MFTCFVVSFIALIVVFYLVSRTCSWMEFGIPLKTRRRGIFIKNFIFRGVEVAVKECFVEGLDEVRKRVGGDHLMGGFSIDCASVRSHVNFLKEVFVEV